MRMAVRMHGEAAVAGPNGARIDSIPATPAARRLSTATMTSYAVGSVTYGVKDACFGTFLLLFYNQLVGIPSAKVGFTVMCALIVDAMVDPAVGVLSDRTRTRWGRRHPWMYASALPIAIGWILLWSPPAGMSQGSALLWLFVAAVGVRAAVSCYEVPSVALTAELSSDYDERTRIMAWRYLFGWAGGLAMLIATYTVFLAPTPAFANGLLNPAGYRNFAIAGAVLMSGAILVSALGTHREIPFLPHPTGGHHTWRRNLAELGETLKNRAFLILMLAGLFAYANQGMSYALSNYNYTYVWGFSGSAVFATLTATLFSGVVIAFVVAPRLGHRFGKKQAATAALLLGVVFQTGPYWLRAAGLFPAVGQPALLPLLFGSMALATAGGVGSFILAASMMADVVEDSEARTGRRSEGVFFAGAFLVQKCTSGLGIFLAGTILGLAGFPERATPATVTPAVVDRLTLIYAATYAVLALLAAIMFWRFPFGRAEHEARLARLTG